MSPHQYKYLSETSITNGCCKVTTESCQKQLWSRQHITVEQCTANPELSITSV